MSGFAWIYKSKTKDCANCPDFGEIILKGRVEKICRKSCRLITVRVSRGLNRNCPLLNGNKLEGAPVKITKGWKAVTRERDKKNTQRKIAMLVQQVRA